MVELQSFELRKGALRQFAPDIGHAWKEYFHRKGETPDKRRELRKEAWKKTRISVGKAVLAYCIYDATSRTIGVNARDYDLTFSAQKAWGNTSSISLSIAGGAVRLIPERHRAAIAAIIIPAEIATSLLRMHVEQKVWQRWGITADPAGTLLTPYLAGIGELAYKASVTYPQDTESRLMVGAIGIYGNIVRIAETLLIDKAIKWARRPSDLQGN